MIFFIPNVSSILECNITITNNRNPILTQYQVEKVNLEKKEMVKYLGVTIDNKLTFNQHINEKSKNATTVLNMLRRNLYFAPRSVKLKAYTSSVLPIMEYASTCWSPTNKKLSNELERVNCNAAKFVANFYPKKGQYEHFSITKLMKKLNWSTLEQRRQEARLTMAYKVLNGHVILDSQMLPKIKFYQPQRSCATPKLWNINVTPAQANAPSVDSFKSYFKK